MGNMIKRLKKAVIGAAIVISSIIPHASATTMFDGLQGPTDHQVELRASTVEDKISKENLTGRLVLKGWQGQKEDSTGYWWFVNVPYQHLTTNKDESNKGVGDVTIGAGPTGMFHGIGWFSYVALTFPTGDTGYQRPEKDYSLDGFLKDLSKAQDGINRLKVVGNYAGKVSEYESLPENRPALGTGRTDVSLGLCLTKLWKDGKYGLNESIDYTITGTDNQGNNPADMLSAGILGDIEPVKDFRIGTGVEYWTDLNKVDGASLTGMLQKGFKKYKYVVELRVDKGIMNTESTKGTVAFKYNF